jgi:flagellar hook assembly protein FlgD
MGLPVKTIHVNISNFELSPLEIYWDGTNDNNVKLSSGMYVYRFIVKNADGATSVTTQKLVKLK